MAGRRTHILLVEDEAVLCMDLCDTLEAEGYTVVGTASNGRRALELFQTNPVDLLLCDVHIKGEWDGIETATRLLAQRRVPLIFLTALADKETLDRALYTAPAAYLTKPVTTAGLRASIELALRTVSRPEAAPTGPVDVADPALIGAAALPRACKDVLSRDTILQFNNYVFIKDNYQFVRIPLKDILLLEANNTYTTFVTPARKYALRLTLGSVLERLHIPHLVRVHRSYAINIESIESFTDNQITVAGQTVPLGRQYKEAFLQQFQFH